MNFQRFTEKIAESGLDVHGAAVYEDGKLIGQYGDTTGRYPIYSCTKAVTSLAVGMAVEDGVLDINQSILHYLPQYAIEELSEKQTETFAQITVRRLLTMSVAGLPFSNGGDNWIQNALSSEIDDVEEKTFNYSNVCAYLAGVAVSVAEKQDLYEMLTQRLFDPLNIQNPPYATSPCGFMNGATNMELSVNELSRIGMVFAGSGAYKDRRIVSKEYIREACSIQQMNREGGYGYFIWKYRDGFSINGKWGQKCYILPDRKRMVTFLSNIPEGSDMIRGWMEEYILQ